MKLFDSDHVVAILRERIAQYRSHPEDWLA